MRAIAAVLGLVLVAAACSGGAPQGDPGGTATGATDTPSGTIVIEGFLFEPETLTVPAGTEVTWENRDEILHTATSGTPEAPTDLFDGTMPARGDRFTFTFADPGSYRFFCSRHNHMRGTIEVTT